MGGNRVESNRTLQLPSDEGLLSAIAIADQGALRQLHDRHAPWLRSRLARRCADRDIVATVLQDTFIAVWRGAARYQGTGEVAAWIWGIARRRLAGELRRRRDLPKSFGLAQFETSAEDHALAGTEHGDLAVPLSRLPPELRAVVEAAVLDGFTSQETGERLGIPSGTVKTRMRRARAQLRSGLA